MGMFSFLSRGRNKRQQALLEQQQMQRQMDSYNRSKDRLAATERTLFEQTAYAPPFELVNPWAQFFDGMKLLFPLFPSRFDFRYSQNWIFLTQGQLDLFRSYSRYLVTTNAYAEGALQCLADYVIGTGFSYHCQSRKGVTPNKPLEKLCNKFLEDFLNKNCWWEYEREFYVRPKRDGDAFLRFFAQEDGVTQVRAVEPEQVRWPGSETGPAGEKDFDWSYGIKTTREDKVTHLAYRIWYSSDNPEGEEVPAEEMLMFKNSLDKNIKRGISTFFNLQDLLDDASKLLRAGRQGEAVRQSIAYIRQFAMANQAAVLNLQASDADYQLPKFGLSPIGGGGQQEQVSQRMPGEVHDIPQEMEMQDPPNGNALNAKIMLDSTLRCAAVKLRVPAWVLTGDLDANFASALVAESPFTKRLERDQFERTKEYEQVCERALQIGAAQGILPEDVCEMISVLAEGQPVAARDMKQETDISMTLVANRIMSRRTAAERESLDYDEEQAKIKEEDAELGVLPATPGNNYPPNGTSPTSPTTGKTPSPTPAAVYQRLAPRPERGN